MVRYGRERCSEVEFSAEDASRTDLDYLGSSFRSRRRSRRDDSQYSGHGRLQHAGRIRRDVPDHRRARSTASRVSSSARIATMISALPSRIPLPRSLRAHARWNARSTASASARATRRLKKSPSRCKCAARRSDVRNEYQPERNLRDQPPAFGNYRRLRSAEQGRRRRQRVRPRSGYPSGRHPEKSADLRNYFAASGRCSRPASGPRKTFRPQRSACASSRVGLHDQR